jgi:hypothetical protein
LSFDIIVRDGADVATVAESVFRYVASDPDDLFPDIEETHNFHYQADD